MKTKTATLEEKPTAQHVDRLKLHHQMYERRLRLLKERGGLTEKDAADRANSPWLFDTDEQVAEAG